MNDWLTGRHIAAARTLAGMSVRDLARAASIGSASVSRIEKIGASAIGSAVTSTVLQAIVETLRGSGIEIRKNDIHIFHRLLWERAVNEAVGARRARHVRYVIED